MVTITTLVDNCSKEGSNLDCEHGLSLFIEYRDLKILFDTGASSYFISNADKLKVNLSQLDLILLSHSHYDHTGGVNALLERESYNLVEMWSGKGFEKEKFSKEGDTLRFLGYDFDQKSVNKKGIIWRTVCSDTVMVRPGVWIISLFDHPNEIEEPNPRFVTKKDDGKLSVDWFDDEIALVLDTPKGVVMVVGCSHPGILNMVDTVADRFSKPLYALIGGIHLFDASSKRRESVVAALLEKEIPLLALSHCTGDKAMKMISTSHSQFIHNSSGTIITI